MTKNDFWILNLVSGLLVLLLFGHYFLSRTNNQLGAQLNQERISVNNGRQLQPILENMARRIAGAGETNVGLKVLLTKYDIRITPDEAKPVESAAPASKAKK